MPKTPKNKTSAYWQKRFMALEALNNGKGLKSFEYISKQYDIAAKELDEKISAWYARLAKNNDITLAEAKKLMDDYIFFYNNQRIQLKTKLTPLELRRQYVA